jgi:hypothetical protein
MKMLLGPGLFLLTLALILWVMGSITSRNRPRSEMGKYAISETEENKLLIPILALLGLIGTGVGVWGYLID